MVRGRVIAAVRRLGVLLAGLSVVAALAACTTGGTTATPGPGGSGATCPSPVDPPRQYRIDERVLRVRVGTNGWGGGSWGNLTVFGDGRVITEGWIFHQGPVASIGAARSLAEADDQHPGPALMPIKVQRISPTSMSRLVDLALAAGVGRDVDLGGYEELPTDQAEVQFWIRVDGEARQTSAYALGDGFDDQSGLSQDQRAARRTMETFVVTLTDLDGACGVEVLDEQQEFVPAAVVAMAQPWPPDWAAPDAEVAWPGPDLPGERLPSGIDCVVVTGAELTALLDAVDDATQQSAWLHAEQRWKVALRTLLPDESACP